MNCFYCPKSSDLRPYGPGGTMVCFKCAMQTPDRKKETEKNFISQLDACGPVAIVGEEIGPYPAPECVTGRKGVTTH